MKQAKKLLALVLALALSLAAVPVFAADEDKTGITVLNAKEGETYSAYKVFDVSYDADQDMYAYTISADSPVLQVLANVDTAAGTATSKFEGLTFTKIPEKAQYSVAFNKETFSAAALAAFLKGHQNSLGEAENTETAAADGPVNLDVAEGYYFVASSNTEALCNLDNVTPYVEIRNKSNIVFDKTVDEEKIVAANVGRVVSYKITGEVPETEGFESYTYKITDTMSAGLTLQEGTLEIRLNGTEYKEVTPSVATADGVSTIVVDFSEKIMDLAPGATIVVSYSAEVNENAVGAVSPNTATLEYSNDPTVTGVGGTGTVTEKAYVTNGNIVVDKFVSGSDDVKLAGAKFKLYMLGENDEHLYYRVDADYKVTFVPETETVKGDEKATNGDGAASFAGLPAGTYYLIETEAPAGYNLMTEAKEIAIPEVTVTEGGLQVKEGETVENKTDATEISLIKTALVPNEKGAQLPATGGIGTTIFYVAGAILLLGAGVLLVTKKRAEGGEEPKG